MFRFFRVHLLLLGLVASCLFPSLPVVADVNVSGDVNRMPPTGGGTRQGRLTVGVGNGVRDLIIGEMTIDGGTRLSYEDGVVADRERSFGIVSLVGEDTTWTLTDELIIADEGTAEVSIASRARLNVGDDVLLGNLSLGVGTVNVSGLFTFFDVDDDLTIGNAGVGKLAVRNAAWALAEEGFIGHQSGGVGIATVEHHGSEWRVEERLTIGNMGDGTLHVLNGGVVRDKDATVGSAAGSHGLVEVSGLWSAWLNEGLIIGSSGTGRIDITDQARVEDRAALMGATATGHGEATVRGRGSLWSTEETLAVGVQGTARLTVAEEGLVRAGGVVIGQHGRIVLTAGRVEARSIINRGVVSGRGNSAGQFTNDETGEIRADAGDHLIFEDPFQNEGQVEAIGGRIEFLTSVDNVEDKGQIAVRNGILHFRGGLQNDGTLGATFGTSDIFGVIENTRDGAILVAGDSGATFYDDVNNAGTLVVLPGATALFLRELAFTRTGSLAATLAGGAGGQSYPQLEVGGSLELDGSLAVELADGFAPSLGDSFLLAAAAGGIAGAFDDIALPGLENGLEWLVQSDADSFVLSVVQDPSFLLPADFSGDGVVGEADFDVWNAGFGATSGATKAQGDADGDGAVGGADFLLWQRGFSAASAPTGSAVPEPSGAIVLFVLVWGAIARRAPRWAR